jgi:hypothetical protein
MFGKASWFQRRKYGGWGITPRTWQGYAYVIVSLAPVFLFIFLLPEGIKEYAVGLWLLLVIADTVDIWIHLKLDEREKLHEAISERNAAWFMGIVLSIGLVAEIVINSKKGIFHVNPFIALALFGAVIVKSVTNLYLERRS